MRLVGVAAVLVIFLASPALAQEPAAVPDGPVSLGDGITYVRGGEPGVGVAINGVDIAAARGPRSAIAIDPATPANLSLRLAPPAETLWNLSAFRVGLVVSGPGSEPPDALSRLSKTTAKIPPGTTVWVNRTIDLSTMRSIGAGVFLMKVAALDENDAEVFAQEFYVHVEGNIFLTAAGATVTVMSVAAGYGLWKLALDIKELYDAWDRHRKQKAEAKLRKRHNILTKSVDVWEDAERMERRLVLRWTATGLGLGAVVLSWAGFLGYVAFDALDIVQTSLEAGGILLLLALLFVAGRRYARRAHQKEAVRTLIPEGPAPSSAPTPTPTPSEDASASEAR